MAVEKGPARYAHAAYGMHRLHVTLLLREGAPSADAELLADTLLAILGAEHFAYLRQGRGMSVERIKAGWSDTVRRTFAGENG